MRAGTTRTTSEIGGFSHRIEKALPELNHPFDTPHPAGGLRPARRWPAQAYNPSLPYSSDPQDVRLRVHWPTGGSRRMSRRFHSCVRLLVKEGHMCAVVCSSPRPLWPSWLIGSAPVANAQDGCKGLAGYAQLKAALIQATMRRRQRAEQPDVGHHRRPGRRRVRGRVQRDRSRGAVARQPRDLGAEGQHGERVQPRRVVEQRRVRAAGGLALSTANLYSAVQPGGSLFGLQESNPVEHCRSLQGALGTATGTAQRSDGR